MVKVLHIGTTTLAHIWEVIKQIEEFTDFKNVILSDSAYIYSDNSKRFPNIPVYVFDHKHNFDQKAMEKFISVLINKEKPDLIIGHSLFEVSVLLKFALTISNVPGIGVPWGVHDFIQRKNQRAIFLNNLSVIKHLNFLAETNSALISLAANTYGITQTDFIFTGTAIDLEQYTNHVPDTTIPKLLLAKPRCERYIYESLPAVFKKYPKLEVHAFTNDQGCSLAKQLGVYNKIIYHNYPLPQKDFANLIKKCNIVHTITGDPGTGGTALQASYAGCINLMRRGSYSLGILDDRVNAIWCERSTKDVTNKLLYSIKNLTVLCNEFKKNNKHLIKYDQLNTWKHLYQGMQDCLSGKKGKIISSK